MAVEDCYAGYCRLAEPIRISGEVVHGFKRGSKELGIPTANLDAESLKPALDGLDPGVYFGWASVGTDPTVYKTVMSIGWNPYFKNEKKTVEPHLLHEFPADFYGEELRLVISGYLRPEKNFPSLDALIAAIHSDIDTARERLDSADHNMLREDAFLRPRVAASGGEAR